MSEAEILSPTFVAVVSSEDAAISARRRQEMVIDLMPETRLCYAIRVLFLAGFNTSDIATIVERREAEVVKLLHQAPGPVKVEVIG